MYFRIGYAVWLLKNIARENDGNNIEIKIMYDIACLLQKHLKVNLQKLVETMIHLNMVSYI